MQKPVLLPLTAAVLAAHGWLLWQLPAWSDASAATAPTQAAAPAFTTRSIAAPPPPAPAPAPVARPQPKPRPKPAAAARPEAAAPAPMAPAAADRPETALPEEDSAALAEPAAPAEPIEAAAVTTAAVDTAAVATAAAAPAPPAEAAPAPLPDVQLPPPMRLSFDVSGQAKRFDYHASAELLWQHDGQHYELRQQIKAFLIGTRAQTSSGQLSAAGLVPQRFVDQGRREKSAELDFAAGQARFTPAAAPAPIEAGAQDRLSVFFQLSALLAAAPERYPAGSEISFTTVGSNDAERWTFRVHETETLELPVGPMPALRLERLPRHAGDQQGMLWLAPALGYLPARIRLTQGNGDFADLRLQAHTAP